MAYSLRLIEDRVAPCTALPAPRPGAPRVLYALSGTLEDGVAGAAHAVAARDSRRASRHCSTSIAMGPTMKSA